MRAYISLAVGFVACPCHLPLTLPILLSLAAGTAVGAWLLENTVMVYIFSTLVFTGGLTLGWVWLDKADKFKRQPRLEQVSMGELCERCEAREHSMADTPDKGEVYK